MARLVGNATAKPISHAPANLCINPELQPVITDVMVKLMAVSNVTTMSKAVMKTEYLALIFNVASQPIRELYVKNIIVL